MHNRQKYTGENLTNRTGKVSQWVICLLCKVKALRLDPQAQVESQAWVHTPIISRMAVVLVDEQSPWPACGIGRGTPWSVGNAASIFREDSDFSFFYTVLKG